MTPERQRELCATGVMGWQDNGTCWCKPSDYVLQGAESPFICDKVDYHPDLDDDASILQVWELLEQVKAQGIYVKIETAVGYPDRNPWQVHLRRSVDRVCVAKSFGENDRLSTALTAAVAEMVEKEGGG